MGPCIFYNGDFNVNDTKNAQGFANENTLLVSSIFTYGAVGVVSNSGVTIYGIFTNNQAVGYDNIDPATANWEIRKNMNSTGGTLVASGSAAAQWTYTGRSANSSKNMSCWFPSVPKSIWAVASTGLRPSQQQSQLRFRSVLLVEYNRTLFQLHRES